MRLRALSALPLALLASAAVGTPATADTTLPLTGFSHMVVDSAHSHIFVTGSSADSTIRVLNTSGAVVASIPDESGAGGMVLDGNTLYVARCGWGVIDEIDTQTLTRSDSFPAAVNGTCDLGFAGGRLWYSDSTDQQWGELMSVSLDASHTEIDSGAPYYEPMFASTPAHPDWLVVAESGLSPATTYVEDVTNPSNLSLLSSKNNVGGGDMAITPDGATLLAPDGGGQVDGYSLPGLSQAGVYPMDPYPNSVAVSPTGDRIAGGSMSYYGKDVYVFKTGNSTPMRTYDFASTTYLLYPGGLAFSPDGRSVYAVTHSSTSAPVFRVLSALPAPPAGSVSIKASAGTINAGKSVTLTVHLGTSSANRSVSVYRQPVGTSSPILVTTRTVGAGSNLSYAVKPSQDTVYTARWAGDASFGAATSAGARVNVRLVMHRATAGGYRTSSGVRLYHFTTACEKAAHTGCPRFLAWSSPLQPGRTISFVAQGRTSSGKWVTIAKGSHAAGSSGKLGLTLFYRSNGVIGVTQRIRFSTGNSSTVLGSTSSWLSFRITK